MSKPHCWKGQGLVIDVNGSDGRHEILVCSWQILHFLTRSVASSCTSLSTYSVSFPAMHLRIGVKKPRLYMLPL